jgi:hypothetical protein
MSQLTSKLGSRGEVVRLYGTTPPRSGSSPDLIMSAAEKLVARMRGLPLDGFVVYDLQDESCRTAAPRPFPFIPTVDSRGYSKRLGELTGKSTVCYKCIARLTEAEWLSWLAESSRDYGIEVLSLVGRPTSRGAPFPLALSRAYQLAAAHNGRFVLGGVAIAERHDSEHAKAAACSLRPNSGATSSYRKPCTPPTRRSECSATIYATAANGAWPRDA